MAETKEFVNRMEAAVPVTADIGSAVSQIHDSPQHLNQDGIARQPSRTSGRPRPNVNYTTMAAGTGEISASLDYNNEAQGKNQGQKLKGIKIN